MFESGLNAAMRMWVFLVTSEVYVRNRDFNSEICCSVIVLRTVKSTNKKVI